MPSTVPTILFIVLDICDAHMPGIHMQWETAVEIYIYIGRQLTTHLDSKEALFGIGLIRYVTTELINKLMHD